MRRPYPTFTSDARSRGFTLIELLVVLGIIAVLLSLTLPSMIRNGLFSSRKSNFAGRELFEVLRGAKIYAATHNVETAVVYGGDIVADSETNNPVAIIDSMTIVRRLRSSELDEIQVLEALLLPNFPDFEDGDEIFVPLGFEIIRDAAGNFVDFGGTMRLEFFPNQTCILSDIFEVETTAGPPPLFPVRSLKGLRAIHIWDPSVGVAAGPPPTTFFYEPRPGMDYEWDKPGIANYLLANTQAFPAHVFLPSGELDNDSQLQRITIHAGVLPTAAVRDRFYKDVADVSVLPQTIDVIFTGTETLLTPIYQDTLTLTFQTIDIDVDLALYTATGRVKVSP